MSKQSIHAIVYFEPTTASFPFYIDEIFAEDRPVENTLVLLIPDISDGSEFCETQDKEIFKFPIKSDADLGQAIHNVFKILYTKVNNNLDGINLYSIHTKGILALVYKLLRIRAKSFSPSAKRFTQFISKAKDLCDDLYYPRIITVDERISFGPETIRNLTGIEELKTEELIHELWKRLY